MPYVRMMSCAAATIAASSSSVTKSGTSRIPGFSLGATAISAWVGATPPLAGMTLRRYFPAASAGPKARWPLAIEAEAALEAAPKALRMKFMLVVGE